MGMGAYHDSWFSVTICGLVALAVSQLASHCNLFWTCLMDAIDATEALLSNSHACFHGKLHSTALVYMF